MKLGSSSGRFSHFKSQLESMEPKVEMKSYAPQLTEVTLGELRCMQLEVKVDESSFITQGKLPESFSPWIRRGKERMSGHAFAGRKSACIRLRIRDRCLPRALSLAWLGKLAFALMGLAGSRSETSSSWPLFHRAADEQRGNFALRLSFPQL